MTLNPITALFEQIQKLITEHGSTIILRDHLALFKDQLIIYEKKFATLAAENSVLKAEISALRAGFSALINENIDLKADLSALINENIDLKSKINELESDLQNANEKIERQKQIIETLQRPQGTKKYNEITEKVLKLFFDSGIELPVNYIARALSIDINTALYHFDILLKDKLITQTKGGSESSWTGTSDPDMFDLTSDGRKYVIENKTS